MNAGLIGLGDLSLKYVKGLALNNFFYLVAVSDNNKNAAGRLSYPEQRYYESYKEMIEEENLDYVIICSPLSLRFEEARYALEHNVNVICESPLSTSKNEIDELMNLAKKKNLVFNTIYHFQNGEEVRQFNKLFDPRKIQRIEVNINNPYSKDGLNIDDNKLDLKGCYLDSAVNILSMIKIWLPFNSVKLVNREFVNAKNVDAPIYAKVNCLIDNIPVVFSIDWREDVDNKVTYLTYDNKPLTICHSSQEIIYGDWKYTFNAMDRLTRHYYNYFSSFDGLSNFEMTKKIHEVLFKFDPNNHQ